MGELDAVLHTPWERSLGHRHVLLSLLSNHTPVFPLILGALVVGGLQAHQCKRWPLAQLSTRSLPAGLWGSQVETSSCSSSCGIIEGVEEMEKEMSHQKGWSEILCEHFSSWKSQLTALSIWKSLSSWLGGYY